MGPRAAVGNQHPIMRVMPPPQQQQQQQRQQGVPQRQQGVPQPAQQSRQDVRAACGSQTVQPVQGHQRGTAAAAGRMTAQLQGVARPSAAAASVQASQDAQSDLDRAYAGWRRPPAAAIFTAVRVAELPSELGPVRQLLKRPVHPSKFPQLHKSAAWCGHDMGQWMPSGVDANTTLSWAYMPFLVDALLPEEEARSAFPFVRPRGWKTLVDMYRGALADANVQPDGLLQTVCDVWDSAYHLPVACQNLLLGVVPGMSQVLTVYAEYLARGRIVGDDLAASVMQRLSLSLDEQQQEILMIEMVADAALAAH